MINGKNFKYPKGETYKDVRKRVFSLIKKISYNKKNIIIITHNVFIRVLLGIFFKINDKNLYKILINYGQNLNFIWHNKRLYPNFSRLDFLNLFPKNIVN